MCARTAGAGFPVELPPVDGAVIMGTALGRTFMVKRGAELGPPVSIMEGAGAVVQLEPRGSPPLC